MGERVIAVVGPTAAGKSGLAVDLALALDGEVINADSMQLYRGMDIGTAKLTLAERQGVPHHLLDVWDVRADRQRGRLPGGWPGRPSPTSPRAASVPDPGRRLRPVRAGRAGRPDLPRHRPGTRGPASRPSWTTGPAALHTRLAAADPAAAAAILPSNGRRIVRALEVIELTGRPFTATLPDYGASIPALQLGLRPAREELDRRIETRVDQMWAAGFEDEVRQPGRSGPARGPHGQPCPRLPAAAPLPGRGVDPGPGPGRDRPRHPPLRPPPGVLVPP